MQVRRMRWIALILLAIVVVAPQRVTTQDAVVEPPPFDAWLAGLIDEADEKGYDADLIREALVGLEPLPRVIQADRTQAELNPGLDRYLASRLTRPVILRGREM